MSEELQKLRCVQYELVQWANGGQGCVIQVARRTRKENAAGVGGNKFLSGQ